MAIDLPVRRVAIRCVKHKACSAKRAMVTPMVMLTDANPGRRSAHIRAPESLPLGVYGGGARERRAPWRRRLAVSALFVTLAQARTLLTRRRPSRILNESPPRAGLAGPPGLRPWGFLRFWSHCEPCGLPCRWLQPLPLAARSGARPRPFTALARPQCALLIAAARSAGALRGSRHRVLQRHGPTQGGGTPRRRRPTPSLRRRTPSHGCRDDPRPLQATAGALPVLRPGPRPLGREADGRWHRGPPGEAGRHRRVRTCLGRLRLDAGSYARHQFPAVVTGRDGIGIRRPSSW